MTKRLVKHVSKELNIELQIKLLSDMHLGSGKADVNLDADIVYDENGMPYFPAKRLKGLLYESAREILEMSAVSGKLLFTEEAVENLFGHNTAVRQDSSCQMIIHNLYLQDYEQNKNAWDYLTSQYPTILNSQAVLDEYTYIRYQTSIDEVTGTALEHSLHNLRVLKAGCCFKGTIRIINGDAQAELIMAAACKNLHYAGGKRNRGLGKLDCSFPNMEAIISSGLKRR